jgi:hypothetical protein
VTASSVGDEKLAIAVENAFFIGDVMFAVVTVKI